MNFNNYSQPKSMENLRPWQKGLKLFCVKVETAALVVPRLECKLGQKHWIACKFGKTRRRVSYGSEMHSKRPSRFPLNGLKNQAFAMCTLLLCSLHTSNKKTARMGNKLT